MIEAVQEQELVLATNTSPITFSETDIRTNSAQCFNGWLNHNTGSAQFNLVSGGYYEIDFNANVTSATAGAVALGIYADGVKLNGGETDAVIGTAGDYENVSMKKYIRVCGRGNVTITINSIDNVVYAGTSTTTQTPIIKNANIIIRRYA